MGLSRRTRAALSRVSTRRFFLPASHTDRTTQPQTTWSVPQAAVEMTFRIQVSAATVWFKGALLRRDRPHGSRGDEAMSKRVPVGTGTTVFSDIRNSIRPRVKMWPTVKLRPQEQDLVTSLVKKCGRRVEYIEDAKTTRAAVR